MWKESAGLPRCSKRDCLCGLPQIHRVLEIKNDLVSMVKESSRTCDPQHDSTPADHAVERRKSWRLRFE